MNIGKRFWSADNTDINRMFPGYNLGETTQRIAAGVFEHINDYRFGIHFTSYYMQGCFTPHVRMMKTGFEDVEKAKDFGLPYVYRRDARPYDTTTLNYTGRFGTQRLSPFIRTPPTALSRPARWRSRKAFCGSLARTAS